MNAQGNSLRFVAIFLAGVFVHGVAGRVWSSPSSTEDVTSNPFSYVGTLRQAGTAGFGFALGDFHGDLLVGASGRAYLYDIQTGSILQKYAQTGGSMTDGNWITGHGTQVAVGSPNGTGIVKLFDASSGQLLQTYTGSEVGDRFGTSVASNGVSLFVGAPELRSGFNYYGQGKVEVFNTLGDSFTIDNPEPGTRPFDAESFGFDVKVVENDLYVGALYDSDGGKVWHIAADSGETLFEYSNPHGGRPQFGVSLDVAGDYLLVGANQSSASGTSASGAAYLFDRSNGNLLHTFFDPVPGVLDNFGIAVALVDEFAVIGAHSDDDGKSNGAVFVFDIQTGLHVQSIETPLSTSRSFGSKVQRVGDWLAVTETTSGGKVHIYSLVPEPSTGTVLMTIVVSLIIKQCFLGRRPPVFITTEGTGYAKRGASRGL